MTIRPTAEALARYVFESRLSLADNAQLLFTAFCLSQEWWWTAFFVFIAGLLISFIGSAAIEGMR